MAKKRRITVTLQEKVGDIALICGQAVNGRRIVHDTPHFPAVAQNYINLQARLCDGEMRLSFPCTPAFTLADYLGVKEQESRSKIPNYSQACNFPTTSPFPLS